MAVGLRSTGRTSNGHADFVDAVLRIAIGRVGLCRGAAIAETPQECIVGGHTIGKLERTEVEAAVICACPGKVIGRAAAAAVNPDVLARFSHPRVTGCIHAAIEMADGIPARTREAEGHIITGQHRLNQSEYPRLAAKRIAFRRQVVEGDTAAAGVFPPETGVGHTTAFGYIYIVADLGVFHRAIGVNAADMHAHVVPSGSGEGVHRIVAQRSAAVAKRPEDGSVEVAARPVELQGITIGGRTPAEICIRTAATAVSRHLMAQYAYRRNTRTFGIHTHEVIAIGRVGMAQVGGQSASVAIVKEHQ